MSQSPRSALEEEATVLLGAGEEWRRPLREALAEPVLLASEIQHSGAVRIAVIAGQLTEPLSCYPKLELAITLRAGVDDLLAQDLLPEGLVLIRANDPSLTAAMTESVILHVLSAHRQVISYRAAQRRNEWLELSQPLASQRRVGVLGLGELGAAAARSVSALGFPVEGWSRTPKDIPGVRCHAGQDALPEVLAASDILLCLLPLTTTTRGLLDAKRLALLPTGATLISVGRGGQVVEEDLIDALDNGQLGAAILDVFAIEPLPLSSPLWNHERVLLYPHVAADPHPLTGAPTVAKLVAAHRAGELSPAPVDPIVGY